MSDLFLLASTRRSDSEVPIISHGRTSHYDHQDHERRQQQHVPPQQRQHHLERIVRTTKNHDNNVQLFSSSNQTTTSSATILHRNHNGNMSGSMLSAKKMEVPTTLLLQQKQQYYNSIVSSSNDDDNNNDSIFDSIRSTTSSICSQEHAPLQENPSLMSFSPPPTLSYSSAGDMIPMNKKSNNIHRHNTTITTVRNHTTSSKNIEHDNVIHKTQRQQQRHTQQQQQQPQQRRTIFDSKVQQKYHTSGTTSFENAAKIREMIAQLWLQPPQSPSQSYHTQLQEPSIIQPERSLDHQDSPSWTNHGSHQQPRINFDGLESRRNSWNNDDDRADAMNTFGYDNDANTHNSNSNYNVNLYDENHHNNNDSNNNNNNNDIPEFYETSYFYNTELEKDFVKWTPATTTAAITRGNDPQPISTMTTSNDKRTTTTMGYHHPALCQEQLQQQEQPSGIDNNNNIMVSSVTLSSTTSRSKDKKAVLPILPFHDNNDIQHPQEEQHLLSAPVTTFLSHQSPRICWHKQLQQQEQQLSQQEQTPQQQTEQIQQEDQQELSTESLLPLNTTFASYGAVATSSSPSTKPNDVTSNNDATNRTTLPRRISSNSHSKRQISLTSRNSTRTSISSYETEKTVHAQSLLLGITFLAVWTSSNMMAPNLTYMSYDYHMKNEAERDLYFGSYCSFVTSVLSLPISTSIGISIDMLYIDQSNNNVHKKQSHDDNDVTNANSIDHKGLFYCFHFIASVLVTWYKKIPYIFFNRKMIFIVTCLLSGISCIGTAYTTTYYQLLLCRFFNGGFQAGTVPIIFSLLSDLFDVHDRNIACSGFTAMMGLGIIGGQVYAGSMIGTNHRRTFPYQQQTQSLSSRLVHMMNDYYVNNITSSISSWVLYDLDHNDSEVGDVMNQTLDFQNDTFHEDRYLLSRQMVTDMVDDHDNNQTNFNLLSVLFYDAPTGWASAFIVSGWFTIVCSILCIYFVHEPIRGGKEKALQDLIKAGTKYEKKLTWEQFYNAMKHNQSNRLLLWQGLVSSLPWGILFVFLNDYLSQERGFTVSDATFLVAIFGIGCAAGGIIGGYYGQVIQTINRSYLPIFMSITTLLGIIPFVILFNTSFTNAHSIQALLLALSAGLIASLPSVNVRPCLLNVNLPETRSAALTAANLFIMIGRGFGPSCVTLMMLAFHINRQYSLNISLILFWCVASVQLALLAKTLPHDQDAMELELANYAAQRMLENRQNSHESSIRRISNNGSCRLDVGYVRQGLYQNDDNNQASNLLPEDTMLIMNHHEEPIEIVTIEERMTSFDDVAAKETLEYVRDGILELPLSPLFYRCVYNKDTPGSNIFSQQFNSLHKNTDTNDVDDVAINNDEFENEIEEQYDELQIPYVPTLNDYVNTTIPAPIQYPTQATSLL